MRGIADRTNLPWSDGFWLSSGRLEPAVEPQPTRPQAKRLRRQFCPRIAIDVGSCRQMRLDTGPALKTSLRSWAPGGAEGRSAPDGRTLLPPPRQTGKMPFGRGRTQLLIHNVYCVTAPGGLFTQYDTLCYGAGRWQCRCREAHGLTNNSPLRGRGHKVRVCVSSLAFRISFDGSLRQRRKGA